MVPTGKDARRELGKSKRRYDVGIPRIGLIADDGFGKPG